VLQAFLLLTHVSTSSNIFDAGL